MELPNNLDAEKQVLANMIFSKDALIEAGTRLKPEDFYFEKNQIIFATLMKIFNENKAKIEPSVLIDRLSMDNQLEKVGDAAYIIELCDSFIDISNSRYYINTVEERSILRKLILLSNSIITNWKKEVDGNIADYINQIEKETLSITKQRRVENFVKMDTALQQYKLRTQELISGTNANEGTKTGIPTLDRITLGFHPGDLIILAARPSVGKSALALNFLVNAAKSSDKATVMFSLEMGVDQLTNRILASTSGISIRKIQTAKFNKEEELRVSKAIRDLQEMKIFIDETPAIKVIEMRAKLQKLQAAYGDIGLIVVDYIGLITPDFRSKKDNRSLELGEISAALKALARDFKTPILVLSQLNRGVDARKDKIPMLSDLRESGAIEQDADIVLFIHRNDYGESTDGEKVSPEAESISETKLIIAKHRNGALGTIDMLFYKHISKFFELDNQTNRVMTGDKNA